MYAKQIKKAQMKQKEEVGQEARTRQNESREEADKGRQQGSNPTTGIVVGELKGLQAFKSVYQNNQTNGQCIPAKPR